VLPYTLTTLALPQVPLLGLQHGVSNSGYCITLIFFYVSFLECIRSQTFITRIYELQI
jgi:hypothetical protein